jgi:predicted GIY-YIG superfamily endonuclease
MFYCYVLRSEKTRRRYVGSCENLPDRIRRHNAGESKAKRQPTISRKPVGATVMSQPLIRMGEESGLLTRIAATENGS